jgi:transcriptional regulator with XRE-family HTH domain
MTSLNNKMQLYNQSAIARVLRVDQSYISLVLRGKRKGPKALELLKKIQELTGTKAA